MPSEPFALYADIHAVDDHAFVGADEDVFHAVDHAGFHLIAAAGADLNDDVRRAQLELLFVDNVLRTRDRSFRRILRRSAAGTPRRALRPRRRRRAWIAFRAWWRPALRRFYPPSVLRSFHAAAREPPEPRRNSIRRRAFPPSATGRFPSAFRRASALRYGTRRR